MKNGDKAGKNRRENDKYYNSLYKILTRNGSKY